jgi:hypothetical protein
MPARKPRRPPPPAADHSSDDDEFSGKPAEKIIAATADRKPRTNPAEASNPTQSKADREASPGLPKRAVVSMDLRKGKLTKKNLEQLKDWRNNNRGKMVDAYWSAQVDMGRKEFGHRSVIVAGENNNLVIGIPIPALAFEYVISQDVLPLGLVTQMVGPPNSLKSSLAFEFMRWIRQAGGGSNLFEMETKYDEDWNRAITGFAHHEKNVIVDKCNSVEEWQQRLQKRIEWHKAKMEGTKEDPGPGRVFPVGLFVDTIMGKVSYETQEKVHKEGFAGRNFPLEALSITTFMKTVPQLLDEWPFFLCLMNHLKFGKDEMGRETRRTAGGVGVNFQESWELETSVRKSKIESKDWEGRIIQIKCEKNSFGPTGRKVDTRLLWGDEFNEETGKWERWATWDWHWATIKMLTTFEGRIAAALKREDIHVKAEATGDATATAWSATLGMKAKDAVPWDELGIMIAQNEEMKNRIRTALSIKRRPLLEGDYLKLIEGLRENLV